MSYDIEFLMNSIEKWLTDGSLNQGILSNDFTFTSPFWKHADKNGFLEKFLDPTEYIEKSLSNIIKFDPIICCISKDNSYFTLTLTYHTKNGTSVDEVVVCTIKNGLLHKMKKIYDLELTKKAHNL
jgi:CRISPR/Cas system Type II protein with McrA/HNH and RuvC-like nuclease domain